MTSVKKRAPRFHASPFAVLRPRKTRLISLEAGDLQGLEPLSRHGGNSDSKSDGGGRGGREDLPTLGDGKASDLSPSARDPNMKLETTVLNESEGTPRQPDSERGFDREQVEGRSSDHGLPEYGTGNGDNDGLSLRPGEEGKDTSSMARRGHVGDETAEAHARKVADSHSMFGVFELCGQSPGVLDALSDDFSNQTQWYTHFILIWFKNFRWIRPGKWACPYGANDLEVVWDNFCRGKK